MIGLFGEATNVIVAQYADGASVCNKDGFDLSPWWKGSKGLSAIHMPRWASRITLEITEVLVERLQEISEEDAKAEGIHYWPSYHAWCRYDPAGETPDGITGKSPSEAYALLWNSINGTGSWDVNPWVWAITFKVATS